MVTGFLSARVFRGITECQCVIGKGGQIADQRSLLNLLDMTVICRGGNKENGGRRNKKDMKLTVVL